MNAREQHLAEMYYTGIKQDLNSRGICPARGTIIAIKILATMSRNLEKADRVVAEKQIHDVLEHEFSMNSSEY